MKKATLILMIGLSVNISSVMSQDIHFSQFNFSPLTINPALTSAYKDIQATLHHKEQWRTVNAYRTSAFTFEMKAGQPNWRKVNNMTETFKRRLKKGIAFGINVYSDRAGDGKMTTNQACLSIAYHVLLNKENTLSAGISGGFVQRSISPDALRWNSQYTSGVYNASLDPGETFSRQSFVYGDYSAGILWSYGNGSSYMTANDHKHFNIGFSISHLTRPNISFLGTQDKLNWKYVAHASSLLGIKNTRYSLAPTILYMQQGKQTEFTGGLLIKCKFKEESRYTGFTKSTAISLGCLYRHKDAAIPYFLIEIDKYSLGVTYDVNVSGFKNVTYGRGGFEITLRFNSPSPFLYQTKPIF